MLAGEEFTDHPASVCPVIGSFLRPDNDSIGDEHRQAGTHAIHAIPKHTQDSHAAALALVDELLAIRDREDRATPPPRRVLIG